MRILLHSFTFRPSIGGVENVSHTLAREWVKAGHRVTVLTDTPAGEEEPEPYEVVRRAGPGRIEELVRAHDLVHANGASMKLFFVARRCRRPFSWTHPTYQLQCIDGMGWVGGAPAPLDPVASFWHHWRLRGPGAAVSGGARLWLRRYVGSQVAANVAISRHQAQRQPLPRQRVIYNPVDLDRFAVSGPAEAGELLSSADASFTYLGRLISEKGVDDLLRAFAMVVSSGAEDKDGPPLSLKIIGDGPEESNLQALARQLGVSERVRWLGALSGEALGAAVRRCGICVLPSAWEEPMGIVAVELMAAGKPLIVSATGGLAECAADGCLTFPNRDAVALAQVMGQLLKNPEGQRSLLRNGLARARDFNPARLAAAYLDLFGELLK